MERGQPEKLPPVGGLLLKIRITLIFATIIPLIVFSAFILYYVPFEVLGAGWVAAILVAVTVLMLAGMRIISRLIAAVAPDAHRDEAEGPSPRPDIPREQPGLEGRSIRHTIAEAVALIGAIPLLALGYIVVRYALWVQTTENILLILFIVSAVMILGIARINNLTRRIISVAAAARGLRMEKYPAGQDFGRDEIGTLSADLVHIAERLTRRLHELRRTRGFVEHLPHPMIVIDDAGAINFANPAALSLLGYGERELVGVEASSLFVQAEDLKWIMGERGDTARENIWRRKDGTLLPVSVRVGSLARDDDGGGSVLIATDISERERAQSLLRQSERRYRSLFDDSPISLWEEDMSGIKKRIDELRASGVTNLGKYLDEHPDEVAHCASLLEVIDVNKATLALYGADSVEKFRSDIRSFFPKEVLATFRDEILTLAEGKTCFTCDTLARTVSGGERHVRLSWSVLPGHEGTYAHVLLSVIDITERKRAEEDLNMFHELMNRAGECLSIIDVETGRFLYVNETTCASTGYGRGELLAMRLRDIDPSVTEDWDPARERARRATRAGYVREGLIKKRDAGTFPVEVCSSIVTLAGREYMVSTARDITERKKVQKESIDLRNQLAHVTRVASLGVFVASLAHEINQPLAAILNNAQACLKFLEAVPPDIGEVRGALEDIIADDNRASDVIRRLRSMLKKADHEWRVLEINEIVVGVVNLLIREFRARNISVSCNLAPGLPPVRGDAVQLQQVILNLLRNAFEAFEDSAGGHGIILVASSREGTEGIRISVRDSGCGISDGDMPRLFDPFFTTKPGGLGMGLPINKTIVEAHGGRLWAENNPDRGATFHVVLPAAKEGPG